MDRLRIAGITDDSIVDGPGLRLTVFVQGCPHSCKGCHNLSTHSFYAGYDILIFDIIKKARANPLLQGITISGGEPLMQLDGCIELAKAAQELNLDVIIYTGFTFEEILEFENINSLLENVDIIIDGRFMVEERSLDLKYRGSSNQRIIDVKKTLKEKKICLLDL